MVEQGGAGVIRAGDWVTPIKLWNRAERPTNQLPTPVLVLGVHLNEWASQTGVMLSVRTRGGKEIKLSSAWFEGLDKENPAHYFDSSAEESATNNGAESMSENVYEGKVIWLGQNRDGSDRFRVDAAPEGVFFTADGNWVGKVRKFATVKVKVQARGKNHYVTNFKELSPPDDNPRGNGNGRAGSGGGSRPPYKGGGSSGPSARDKYFEDKDKYDKEHREPRIQQQAARRDAIEFLTLLVANGGVSLGSGKADKKAEILELELDRLTAKFWRDTQSLAKLKRAAEESSEPEEVEEQDDFNDDPPPNGNDDGFGDDPDADDGF